MSDPCRLPPAYTLYLAILCLAGCAPPGPDAERPPPPAAADRPRLGINLAPVTDYTREWAFVDVFKASRPWYADGGAKVALDDDGNPLPARGRSADTLMVRELDGHYPAGVYAATYAGAGKVEMSRYDVKKVVKEAPGRIEADVTPGDGGILLAVAESDPKNPVRDLHVWAPGFEGSTSAFHPLFRERLKPFRVLRFMDWQRTNNSTLRQWSQRPKPADPRYTTEAGVPLEVMIDLANACDASPWFCIPHLADDDFVSKFAETVKGRLKPDLHVYVEYSNEVWNGQFAQSRWRRSRANGCTWASPKTSASTPGVRSRSSRYGRPFLADTTASLACSARSSATPGSANRCWRGTTPASTPTPWPWPPTSASISAPRTPPMRRRRKPSANCWTTWTPKSPARTGS